MKHLIVAFLLTLFMLLPTAFSQNHELRYDGHNSIAKIERKVRDVVEVKRAPLFDNAPFLKLRKGDKLVKAKREPDHLGKPEPEPDFEYYLSSGGKFFQLWTQEEDGKLLLSSAFYGASNCLLFDWDLTMENANALRKLLPGEYTTPFSNEQFEAIRSSAMKEFSEAQPRFSTDSQTVEDRLISIPGLQFAEFQGLAFDHFRNSIYKYSIKIGPSVFTIHGQTLLQGPDRVERHEFERETYRGPNAPAPTKLDPEKAKIKRAEYDRMIRFQNLVLEALRPKNNAR